MKIKVFMGTANSYQERTLLQSFAAGAKEWAGEKNIDHEVVRIGRWADINLDADAYQIDFEYGDTFVPCDVAVMFGSWKPREKGHHVIRNSVVQNSKCFVCIETPLLNRSTKEPNKYWRVGVNGFLNQSASWPTVNSEEGQRRLDELGIEWQGWQNRLDGHIVVALQLPADASLRGADINDWAYQTIRNIRKKTDRYIIVRNHPLASMRAFGDHEELARKILLDGIPNIRFSDGAVTPWQDDIKNAYCTVTYTSGLAIDSVIAGIPTVACDAGNFAWSVSSNTVEDIEHVKCADDDTVISWLRQLSACQWNETEMRTGLTWQYLIEVINSIKK